METVLLLMVIVDYLFIVAVGSVDVRRYNVSDFVLKQQLADAPREQARLWRRLHKQLSEVLLLQQLELAVAGVIAVSLLGVLYGPWLGALYAVVGFALAKVVARLSFVQKKAEQLFERTLETILAAVKILRPLLMLLGRRHIAPNAQPTSLDELTNQLEHLPQSVVDSSQKKRLLSVIESENKIAKSVMTPKRNVVMVNPDATFGPVLLSELQKSGHGYYPVAHKNAEPEGVLEIADVADIHSAKKHQKVREYMNEQLVWVEEDTSMYELVQAILQEKRYVLFVRNLNGDFTGVITVADLMQQLLGIVKE